MAATGKYQVIEAQTLEMREHYRLLLEQKLNDPTLPPELRAELQHDLSHAVTKETDARYDLLKAEEEEKKKEKGEGGEDGGQQGSGGSGGGDSGGMKEEKAEREDLLSFETLALLFYLAEQDIQMPHLAPAEPSLAITDPALGAATLLYNPEEKLALVQEPYTLEQEKLAHSPAAFLPALEKHALTMGANVMQLKVHPSAVDLFRKKFGYELVPQAVSRNNAAVLRMRKALTLSMTPAFDGGFPTG